MDISRFRFTIVIISLSLLFSCAAKLYAQAGVLPIDKEVNLLYESELIIKNKRFHSCIYPRSISFITNYSKVQKQFQKQTDSEILNPLVNEYPLHFLSKRLVFYPIINWQKLISKDEHKPFFQSAGVGLRANMNKNWALEFNMYGMRQSLGMFEQAQLDSTGYMREAGRLTKDFDSPYTYFYWNAHISYQAGQYFNFRAGKGVHFLGDGYRSMWLSDNASSYPYAKITANLGKVQYMVLYQFLKDVDTGRSNLPEENKYAVTHLLSWNFAKRFNINLFESVVWRDKMNNDGQRGFDFNYLNPVVFYRPVEYSLGSPDNILMGVGFRHRFFKNTHAYGQLLLDEFNLAELKARNGSWANKFAYQIGLKSYDLLGVKNLFARLEYNRVRPFTYAHTSSMTNYGHMYRPLAHPMGANLIEYLGLLNYRQDRWQFQTKVILTQFGSDVDINNQGQNVYRPYQDHRSDYGNTLLQGQLNRLMSVELKAAYIINSLYNMTAELGVNLSRWERGVDTYTQKYIFLGLRTRVVSIH